MRFAVNDEEWQALRGLMYRRQMLYLSLRRRMDWHTRLVGVKPRISYQALAEDLYLEPGQGKQGGSPTRNELRKDVAALEQAGLLRTLPADRQLIFRLLLADCLADRAVEVEPRWHAGGNQSIEQREMSQARVWAGDAAQGLQSVPLREVAPASGGLDTEFRPDYGGEDSAAQSPPLRSMASPPLDAITSRAAELTRLLRQQGAQLHAGDVRVRAWAQNGVSNAQALAALATARQRRAGSAQPINSGFLDALLADARTAPARPSRMLQAMINLEQAKSHHALPHHDSGLHCNPTAWLAE